ncbi:MAG: galactokinase [Bacteroidetes bacterium]|jgi:galactokinase|nr:galactokinase [Bacteroidota bacterium]
MKNLISKIEKEFSNRFGGDYLLIKSPGRVNLIGEHTDYNDGFVLPAAIDKEIILAVAPNDLDTCRLYAVDKDEYFETRVDHEIDKNDIPWTNYILGVIEQLKKAGDIHGFDCVFGGDIPIGAGLSSSAALEGGVIFGLSNLFNIELSKLEMALTGQRVENDFVGVQCGIMDQFINIHGREEYALKLDCRSLEYEFYPFKREDIHIVLCDTQVRRELATSEYNKRRQQCEEGVKILQKYDADIDSLRDVSFELLDYHKEELNPTVYNRCKFVMEENQRVVDACNDLRKNDYYSFGNRLLESHVGLRDQYEVSCPELDILVEGAIEIQGVLGARMMGGGFGGCTINLVEEDYLNFFTTKMKDRYQIEIGSPLKIYKAKVSGGTKLVQTRLKID